MEDLPTTKRQISILIRDYGGERRKRSMTEKKKILNDIIENKKLGDRELTDEEVEYLKEVFRKYLTGRWKRVVSDQDFINYINEKGESNRFDAARELGCSEELARLRLNGLVEAKEIGLREDFSVNIGAPMNIYTKKRS